MMNIPVVDIYVTGACNLACQYCFGEIDTKPGISRENFQKSLDFAQYVDAKAIEFCGGEPLLYRDFVWAVEIARSRKFELILRTNGLLLSRYRKLIADHFKAVGISLDGSPEVNDKMRPLKGRNQADAAAKFRQPFEEIFAIKALNENLDVILASVATAQNISGILDLGRIILDEKPPIDHWKIYQFVANNFRSLQNKKQFSIDSRTAQQLARDLSALMGDHIAINFRFSDETDGSCLVINRDGDVLIGSRRLGNIQDNEFEEICINMQDNNAVHAVRANKNATYRNVISV